MHADLPSFPRTRESRSSQLVIQVFPTRIGLFDEIELPFAIPFLEPFLPRYRIIEGRILFPVNQDNDMVTLRETIDQVLLVFNDPSFQIACDTDLKRTVSFTRKNVCIIQHTGFPLSWE